MSAIRKVFDTIHRMFVVLGSAGVRFYWDDGFSRASALAYTTLFSLVPFTALSVSMFHAFRVSEADISSFVNAVLTNLLPAAENEVTEQFQRQILDIIESATSNLAALNTVSVFVLIVSSIALFNTIESALNVVWRVTSRHSVVAKIVSFWAVITLGPLLIVVSLYFTAEARRLAAKNPLFDISDFAVVGVFVPILITWAALALIFLKMPSARVRVRDAAFGGLIAALLFELGKQGFAYYVGVSATYSKVYGVLASIPLFLLWLYIAWVVVLYGAEVAYQAGSSKLLAARRKYSTELGEVGAVLGLKICASIASRFVEGKSPPSDSEISLETGSDPELVRSCIDQLTKKGVIGSTDSESEVPSRILMFDPSTLTIGRVIECFLLEKREERDEDLGIIQEIAEVRAKLDPSRTVEDWTMKEFVEYRGCSVIQEG